MAANDTRPVNLDLTKFSFPITAIASITHRICAVISWVGLGIALFTITSLSDANTDGLQALIELIATNFFAQFIAWGILSAFGMYCTTTAKHIIQDFGYFEDLSGGQMISWTALIIGAALTVAAGVYIWA